MKDEISQSKFFFSQFSQNTHQFILENISTQWEVVVVSKFLMVLVFVFSFDLLFKLLFVSYFNLYKFKSDYPYFKSIANAKIPRSFANILSLVLGLFFLSTILVQHPKSLEYLERIYNIIIVLVVAKLLLRVMNAIELYYTYQQNFYKIVAYKAIHETMRTIGSFIFMIIIIAVVFGISSSTILGSIGAITAVLVLVFRDTILGFITSLHVATSKNIKIGDWISIPMYDLEGTIEEISLLTAKIQNFDKTVSTIPTYDLLSTEVKNHQIMAEGNRRRIKKSIVFNINSFIFLTPEKLEKFKKINLISDYIQSKSKEINQERAVLSNPQVLINGRQMTNIGLFRKYVLFYLQNNSNIDKHEITLVRQLEITPNGLPLEIYCFARKTTMEDFEEIQADIFDHILTAAKEFELQVNQITK